MTNTIWTPERVELHLKNFKKGSKLTLPNDAYVSKNFTWNEVLRVQVRNIDMPSCQILENLKTIVDVLQNYRNKIDKPIIITSSWRTPKEIVEIQKAFEQGCAAKPSNTSLHLEGLALDFQVQGVAPKNVYDDFNRSFFGELEYDPHYTHIGLTTFSEKYLRRNCIFSDKIYKKLSVEGIKFTCVEKQKIVKRINAFDWSQKVSTFDPIKNIALYAG